MIYYPDRDTAYFAPSSGYVAAPAPVKCKSQRKLIKSLRFTTLRITDRKETLPSFSLWPSVSTISMFKSKSSRFDHAALPLSPAPSVKSIEPANFCKFFARKIRNGQKSNGNWQTSSVFSFVLKAKVRTNNTAVLHNPFDSRQLLRDCCS